MTLLRSAVVIVSQTTVGFQVTLIEGWYTTPDKVPRMCFRTWFQINELQTMQVTPCVFCVWKSRHSCCKTVTLRRGMGPLCHSCWRKTLTAPDGERWSCSHSVRSDSLGSDKTSASCLFKRGVYLSAKLESNLIPPQHSKAMTTEVWILISTLHRPSRGHSVLRQHPKQTTCVSKGHLLGLVKVLSQLD